ncbi:SCO1431 family membrane protein [Streptomyces albireticuli]|nr:SCO1431 family membrane protein [Streptomyces albireticuli]MCD9142784.1 SCO1431 family membrane protein [Streptomyces albireticuli]MCD9162897.1 SCO1431 family membrane protein [Streptomyces albireticuli]MCD9192457.1 SCO1431 family membrane protein [Streptomyces albireticuli]
MSDTTAAVRARTGGPSDPSEKDRLVEQVAGWTLVVVIAMLITQLGLI